MVFWHGCPSLHLYLWSLLKSNEKMCPTCEFFWWGFPYQMKYQHKKGGDRKQDEKFKFMTTLFPSCNKTRRRDPDTEERQLYNATWSIFLKKEFRIFKLFFTLTLYQMFRRNWSCVTQLKLYTLYKLSSSIFYCLSVSQSVSEASVSPDQISTFSNIYRHTSPLLTQYNI